MKKLFNLLAIAMLLTPRAGHGQSSAPTDHSTMIQFATLDGTKASAYYVPSDQATENVLIIYHDIRGLDNNVKKEAQKWQALLGNVDVYAIDMYDGKMTNDMTMAAKYRDEMNAKHADNISRGLLAKIGPDKRIITMGWGKGGEWAFRGAMLAGNNSIGCIMYYAMPEREEKNVRGLKGDVLYNMAAKDIKVHPFYVEDFGRWVEKSGHKFEMHSLNADRDFAYADSPQHDGRANDEADRYSLVFMKAKFQVE